MTTLTILALVVGLVVGGLAVVLFAALALASMMDDRREAVQRLEIIRHNVRVYLARRHGNQVVMTVTGYLGNPIRLTRHHCEKIRLAS